MDFTDLFAGVRVRDIAQARTWYERLLASEPAFTPHALEAVWSVGEHRWFYLLEDAPGAGTGLVTIMVADLDATVTALRGRGIEPTTLEDHGAARKYVFHDPDGNEIGIGQVPQAQTAPAAATAPVVASIDASAWVAPTAVVTGDVTLGPGSRVLHGAVLNGDHGPVRVGEHVVIMENALLRGRAEHPLTIGDAVLVGPHAHLNGADVADEVFIATGVSMFPGSRVGTGCELRVNSVLHVNSVLPAGTTVPIGWIAAGAPAQLFSPDRHEDLWKVQEPLDFPGTVYGMPRDTSMRELMRRQSRHHAPRS